MFRTRGFALAAVIWSALLAPPGWAQGVVEADALNQQAMTLHQRGKYAEAEALYKRSLDIQEKALGSDHPKVGIALDNLAGLYRDQGRHMEAEILHKRALLISEKAAKR